MTGWTYPTKPGATALRWRNPSYYDGPMDSLLITHHDTGEKVLMNGFIAISAGQTARLRIWIKLSSMYFSILMLGHLWPRD